MSGIPYGGVQVGDRVESANFWPDSLPNGLQGTVEKINADRDHYWLSLVPDSPEQWKTRGGTDYTMGRRRVDMMCSHLRLVPTGPDRIEEMFV